MQETVILYNIGKSEAGKAIISLLKKLEVKVIIAKTKDLMNPIGYTLGLDGYEASQERIKEIPNDDMMVLYGFEPKQIQVLFQIFEQANIPFIPLKVEVNETNVEWSLTKLIKGVKDEYMHLTGMNKDLGML